MCKSCSRTCRRLLRCDNAAAQPAGVLLGAPPRKALCSVLRLSSNFLAGILQL